MQRLGTSAKSSVPFARYHHAAPHAACICTDVCMTHSMVTLARMPNGPVNHKSYAIERMGPVGGSTTVMDVAILDNGKSYSADTLATEIQLQMNAVSIRGGSVYTVVYYHDTESLKYTTPQTADLDSSFILTDDLLDTPELQSTLICRTGTSQT